MGERIESVPSLQHLFINHARLVTALAISCIWGFSIKREKESLEVKRPAVGDTRIQQHRRRLHHHDYEVEIYPQEAVSQ